MPFLPRAPSTMPTGAPPAPLSPGPPRPGRGALVPPAPCARPRGVLAPARRPASVVAAAAPKTKTRYECGECGRQYPQPQGQCDECGAWGSLSAVAALPERAGSGVGGGAGGRAAARSRESARARGGGGAAAAPPAPRPRGWVPDAGAGAALPTLREAAAQGAGTGRIRLPGELGSEVGRVLGGGVVPGACMLIGGDPGVGKSTLLMQVADLMAGAGGGGDGEGAGGAGLVVYVSGEENVAQITARAKRMGVANMDAIAVLCATDMGQVLDVLHAQRPRCVVIDSIQTMYLEDAAGYAGSTSQVRECARAINVAAKETGTPVFLVGHVTKSGEIAGPKVRPAPRALPPPCPAPPSPTAPSNPPTQVLEHMVDVVVYVEGERRGPHRVLRTMKNRFGSTDEIALLDMGEGGMRAVPNPSAALMEGRRQTLGASRGVGSVVAVLLGGRPLLVEIQALATPALEAQAARHTFVSGLDARRVLLVLQILQKHARVRTFGKDVTVNAVGGIDLRNDPSVDLALAVAISSSLYDRPVPSDVAVIGELGLAGELRQVEGLPRRIAEADRMGLRRIVVPALGYADHMAGGVRGEVVPVATLREALKVVLGGSGRDE